MSKSSMSTFEAVTSGKFVTVQFIRKDGTVRTVKALYGVKKYLRPGATSKHDKKKYILVWIRENGDKRYNKPRLINRAKILAIRAEGYEVKSNIKSAYAKLIQA